MSLFAFDNLDEETRTKLVIYFVCVGLFVLVAFSWHTANLLMRDGEINITDVLAIDSAPKQGRNWGEVSKSFTEFSQERDNVLTLAAQRVNAEESLKSLQSSELTRRLTQLSDADAQRITQHWDEIRRNLETLNSQMDKVFSLAQNKPWNHQVTIGPTAEESSNQNISIFNAEPPLVEIEQVELEKSDWQIVTNNILQLERQRTQAVKQLQDSLSDTSE